ncbi:hypothetical protein [Tahibacter amnicola]|uniref:Uncharacterized protein n=1 Tax=Tahibacter amnicola TaxID=2976241 RepID=A0ABY6BKA2_9GAMM|nr:hypothetical protein [Tahibacter amnicola]UXI70290.1 hypothetical protein N4264_11835 [Tahibacter amnicola]
MAWVNDKLRVHDHDGKEHTVVRVRIDNFTTHAEERSEPVEFRYTIDGVPVHQFLDRDTEFIGHGGIVYRESGGD